MELSENIISCITSIINDKRSDETLRLRFVNSILRDDVFALIDMYCTVIYYPLVGEDNNGFHVDSIPDRKGNLCSFVFINTAQTINRQTFTAAHELGHIWNIDSEVAKACKIDLDDELAESIINRFAAELLMPQGQFIDAMQSNTEKFISCGKNGIWIIDFLRAVVHIMNQFLVPYKSVIIRLFELGYLESHSKDILLGYTDFPVGAIYEYLPILCKECGYQNLIQPTMRKHISGLADLLDKAEALNTLAPEKISIMRDTFDLPKCEFVEKIDGNFIIETKDFK